MVRFLATDAVNVTTGEKRAKFQTFRGLFSSKGCRHSCTDEYLRSQHSQNLQNMSLFTCWRVVCLGFEPSPSVLLQYVSHLSLSVTLIGRNPCSLPAYSIRFPEKPCRTKKKDFIWSWFVACAVIVRQNAQLYKGKVLWWGALSLCHFSHNSVLC